MYYEDQLLEMKAMVEARLDADGYSIPNLRGAIESAILKRYLNELLDMGGGCVKDEVDTSETLKRRLSALLEMGGGCTEGEATKLTYMIIRDAEKSRRSH